MNFGCPQAQVHAARDELVLDGLITFRAALYQVPSLDGTARTAVTTTSASECRRARDTYMVRPGLLEGTC